MLKKFWQLHSIDILWLITLLLCGLKFTQYLPNIIDYPISDEGAYLQDGLDIPLNGVKPLYWGSLYNIWYYVGSWIIPDKILLFYTHVKFITCGIPLLLFILLRQMGVSPWVSFITSFLYLISFGNLYIFHKANHTALFLMLVVLVLGYKFHHSIHFWLLVSISILLSAFIRPELFIAFWFAMGYYLFLIFKSKIALTNKLAVTIPLFLITIYLSTLMFGHETRSFYTFQQNFSANWVQWNQVDLDPDQNSVLIFKTAFGEVNSISEAIKSNPSLFIKNCEWNIWGFGTNYMKLGFTHFNIFLPASERAYTLWEAMIMLLPLLAWGWIYFSRNSSFKKVIKENSRWLLFSAMLLVPSLAINILFFPRFNFIVLPIFLTFLLIPLLIFKSVKWHPSKLTAIAIAILFFVFVPVPGKGDNWYFAPLKKNNNFDKTPVKNTVEAIQQLPLKHAVVSFLAEKAIYQYTDKLINGAYKFHQGIRIDEFIDENNIGLFVISDVLLTNNLVNEITGFHALLQDPEQFHFRKIPIENSSNYLLVRIDELNESN